MMNVLERTSVAPVLRRQIFEPLWSWSTGAALPAATREYIRTQWLSHDELKSRQLKLLIDQIAWVHANNPWYRSRLDAAGVKPSDIRTLDDLSRIPILAKDEVRREMLSMRSPGLTGPMMTAKTGGSTGKPVELIFSDEVSQRRNAVGRRNIMWAGWKPGEAKGVVWGNPIPPPTMRDQLRVWLFDPTICLDTMSVSPESVRRFDEEWRDVRPTLLFGHAHSIFVLATMIEELGLTSIRPRGVITSSMMLLPHERQVIERVMRVRVSDLYGSEETGLIGSECERHEGLHLNIEQLVVEVLRDDGTPCGPGETGAVVVTDLLNRAMPFIRYRMEDVAEVSSGPCSCGRGLPIIKRVVGRTADFLCRLDGTRVAGISLIENSLTRYPGVEQMQIVQTERHRILLRVVPSPGVDAAGSRDAMLRYFESEFPGMTIEMQAVQSIPPEPNGKYRFSICRLD